MHAMQAPDIIGVLTGTRQGIVKTEIGTVNSFRVLDSILLE